MSKKKEERMSQPEHEVDTESRFLTFYDNLELLHVLSCVRLKNAFQHATLQRSRLWFFEKWLEPYDENALFGFMMRTQDNLNQSAMTLTGLLRIKEGYETDPRLPAAARVIERDCIAVNHFARLVNYPNPIVCSRFKF